MEIFHFAFQASGFVHSEQIGRFLRTIIWPVLGNFLINFAVAQPFFKYFEHIISVSGAGAVVGAEKGLGVGVKAGAGAGYSHPIVLAQFKYVTSEIPSHLV